LKSEDTFSGLSLTFAALALVSLSQGKGQVRDQIIKFYHF